MGWNKCADVRWVIGADPSNLRLLAGGSARYLTVEAGLWRPQSREGGVLEVRRFAGVTAEGQLELRPA